MADLLRGALRVRVSDVTIGMANQYSVVSARGHTHEGQWSLVNVAAGPGIPVDLRRRPRDNAAAALTLRRLKGRHLCLDQRHRAAWVCGLTMQTQVTTVSGDCSVLYEWDRYSLEVGGRHPAPGSWSLAAAADPETR